MNEYSIVLNYALGSTINQQLSALKGSGFTHCSLSSDLVCHFINSRRTVMDFFYNDLNSMNVKLDWVHAPFIVSKLYSGNSEERAMAISTARSTIDLAIAMRARAVVIHSINNDFDQLADKHSGYLKIQEAFISLLDYANDKCIITTENLPGQSGKTSVEIATRLLHEIPKLMLTLDIGHAHLTGDFSFFINNFPSRIAALHIHDNLGVEDDHLIPGDGIIDFENMFSELIKSGYTGIWGIEINSTNLNPEDICNKIIFVMNEFFDRLQYNNDLMNT